MNNFKRFHIFVLSLLSRVHLGRRRTTVSVSVKSKTHDVSVSFQDGMQPEEKDFLRLLHDAEAKCIRLGEDVTIARRLRTAKTRKKGNLQ